DFSRRLRKEISRAGERALIAYHWPGNVRGLRNVMERAIILSGSDTLIMPAHLGLPGEAHRGPSAFNLAFDHEPTLEEIRERYVRMLHVKYAGHRAKIAAALGISERNIYRLLERYNLVAGESA